MASENVSLKDYIIDMQSAAVKGSAQYEVVLENNTDFIIKRRTATTDRELVILVSKGLYYIKDCKTGHIEELKEQSLNTFLRELKDGMVALHEVHWLSNLYRESVGLIMQVITDETLTDMCRHNVLVNTFDPTWYTRYWKQNSKLFIRLYNMFPSMADRKKYQASIPVIFWIEEQYGANEAMFFAEKLVQSGIMELDFNQNGYSYYERQVSHDPGWFLNVMASPHRINLRRFIDYILFDLYAQGYASVTKSFFIEYLDYLEMQQKFYGKVKEKYPTHFKTEHDISPDTYDSPKEITCDDFDVVTEVQFGGSEGIYLDCYAEGRIQPECEKKRWHLGTYKTLETSRSAMQTLGALGGALTYFASEYLWENGERFLSNRDLRIRALQKRQKEEEAEKS